MSATNPNVGIDAQYRVMREECGALRQAETALLEVRGQEGAEFLQGQLTNDVEGLGEGEGCYALLLDRKGGMRAEMRVLRLAADLIWIVLDERWAADVARHLDMYRIGRDAEVARLEGQTVLALIGPALGELLPEGPRGREHAHAAVGVGGARARIVVTDLGAELIVAADSADELQAELLRRGAEPVDPEAAEILRVEAGRPRLGEDVPLGTIPQEAGLNERAVNFEKGCYIGQETVARLHYKGRPNRHLRRLHGEAPMRRGEPVELEGRALGEIGTAVLSPARGYLALALLRREAEPGSRVALPDGRLAAVEETGA